MIIRIQRLYADLLSAELDEFLTDSVYTNVE